MSKYAKLFFVTAAFLALSACDNVDPGRPMKLEGDIVAQVNNIEITQAELDGLINARRMSGQQVSPEQSLEELIGFELLRQEAVAKGILNDPEVGVEINRQVASAIVSKHVNNILEESPITDEDVAAEYAKQIEARPDKEYDSSHILVATEDEAKQIVQQLDKGADFAELAKQKSTGPSGKSGGKLGWSSPSNYVPEFGLALQNIAAGTYGKEPVKTQFGWHVIKVEAVREANKPTLEQVKPQLQRMIMAQKISEYVENLRNNATVTIVEKEAEPVAAPQVEDKPAAAPAPVTSETPAVEEQPAATE
ncbi:MAG: peptidylprolyl isomerase [Gammaproteobacteria bacterium]|nr:peptidylprolyl isomerase [Gammaproteobacteria bacterium]